MVNEAASATSPINSNPTLTGSWLGSVQRLDVEPHTRYTFSLTSRATREVHVRPGTGSSTNTAFCTSATTPVWYVPIAESQTRMVSFGLSIGATTLPVAPP